MAKKEIVPPPMRKSVLLKMKLKAMLPKAKEIAMTALSVMLIGGSLGYLCLKAPEIHGQFLRHYVGQHVYKIQGRLDGGGGTGFAVEAKSGITYIVTNSHVCEGALGQSEDKTSLLVVSDDGKVLRRKIIENSDFTDLCLLEGLPGEHGLSLGSEAGLGEKAYVVGHPRLRPLSVSSGEVVGKQDVQIMDGVMKGNPFLDQMVPPEMLKDKCDLPKNEIVTIPETPFGPVSLCLNVTKAAQMTTIVIHPGNSGSPMVDMFGRVEGVAFASDGTSWGYAVSLADLQKFLSRY